MKHQAEKLIFCYLLCLLIFIIIANKMLFLVNSCFFFFYLSAVVVKSQVLNVKTYMYWFHKCINFAFSFHLICESVFFGHFQDKFI